MSATPVRSAIAARYATALFALAEAAGALEATRDELDGLRRAIAENADLARLVRSPLYSRAEQSRGMQAVLARAGASGLIKRFVGLVASKRRLFALPDMARAFTEMVAVARGEMTAEVTTAHHLHDEHKARLAEILHTHYGKDVTISAVRDPAILGGLIVKVGSRMIDGSLATKLLNLELAMKEA